MTKLTISAWRCTHNALTQQRSKEDIKEKKKGGNGLAKWQLGEVQARHAPHLQRLKKKRRERNALGKPPRGP